MTRPRCWRNLNQACADLGLPALQGLPEVYWSTCPLVRTLPLLDPYAGHRQQPYVLPEVDITTSLAAGGDEVFVYFSTQELSDPRVIEALVALPLPRRGYLPKAPPEVAARLAASGMVLAPAPCRCRKSRRGRGWC